MTRTRGLASQHEGQLPMITIADYLFEGAESALVNCVLHEAAHIAVGVHHGHDIIWRRKAREFGCIVPPDRYWRCRTPVSVRCTKCGMHGFVSQRTWKKGMRTVAAGYAFRHTCGGDLVRDDESRT